VRRKNMKKTLILSIIIAVMVPYLPFWRFGSIAEPIGVSLAAGIATFVILYPELRKEKENND
jgi:hypothetical protein